LLYDLKKKKTYLRYFKEEILIAKNSDEVASLIKYIKETPSYATALRYRARSKILRHHTWSHRVVEILDFFGNLSISYSYAALKATNPRINAPNLAWIVSSDLLVHPDYQYSIRESVLQLSSTYNIEYLEEGMWIKQNQNLTWLGTFDLIVAVTSLFNSLDKSFVDLPRVNVVGRGTLQRRACFLVRSKHNSQIF
jgi:hypothetical protein